MNSDLEDRQKFRNKEYWEDRFNDEQKSSENTGEEPYEWFSKYADFSDIITKISPPENTKTILVLGCGNSSLSFDLLTDYKNTVITSHDYSSTVINHMRNKYKNEKKLKWEVHDCRKIPNTEDKYDFIIEKAVLDALVAGSKSPWPDTMDAECRDFVRDTKNSVIPALVEDGERRGKFISISFAGPMLRGNDEPAIENFFEKSRFLWVWKILIFLSELT